MKKHLIYSTLLIAVMMFTGCRGGNERGTDTAQVDSFYKSAYDDGKAVQNQDRQQEGKEYKSTGDLSLLDVALPERLDNQTVHYKSLVVYFNKYYRVPNCVAYELTSTMTAKQKPMLKRPSRSACGSCPAPSACPTSAVAATETPKAGL